MFSDKLTYIFSKIQNAVGTLINPATEDKQDTIIAGVEAATDLEAKGIQTIGTTATELTFTGTTKWITITAHIDNTGTVYVGKSNVTNAGANSAYSLEAGEQIPLKYDDTTNAIYVVASIAAQKYIAAAFK